MLFLKVNMLGKILEKPVEKCSSKTAVEKCDTLSYLSPEKNYFGRTEQFLEEEKGCIQIWNGGSRYVWKC